MTVYDVSVAIVPGMAVWPDDPPMERTLVADMSKGSVANISNVSMCVHSGTHVDAPVHFLAGGAGVEEIDTEIMVGPCLVREVKPAALIEPADLEALGLPPETKRLLLKTTNSAIWARSPSAFEPEFVSFSPAAARWIVAHGIRLIGIDYLSVEEYNPPQPIVHRTLLQAGVVPLEGLDLSKIEPGAYTLVCLPLKIIGSDGSPARTLLISKGEA